MVVDRAQIGRLGAGQEGLGDRGAAVGSRVGSESGAPVDRDERHNALLHRAEIGAANSTNP